MNQFVASLRRVFAALAAIMLLSALTPAFSRAQSDAKPADPATPAATEKAADSGKKAKKAKAPKAAKAPKPAKAAKVAKPATTAKPAAAPPAKPKADQKAKPAKVKAPELSLEEQKKADGVYMKGNDWMSARFGWAKRTGEFNGDGLVGYGIGYSHMINRRLAFNVQANHDVVGHFGSRLDEAVSFTGEFQRHFRWKGPIRPYFGLGGGFYVEKFYRTGGDLSATTGGPHMSLGFTSAIDDRHVIGFEIRSARVDGRPGITNPTFGLGSDSEVIWTVKGSYAIAY